MRLLHLLAAELLIAIGPPGVQAVPLQPATLKKAELEHRFLLQVNYEQQSTRQDFRTSRSRTVIFQRAGAVLHMLDLSDPRDGSPSHILQLAVIAQEPSSSTTASGSLVRTSALSVASRRKRPTAFPWMSYDSL
jgi:hypothetical protein